MSYNHDEGINTLGAMASGSLVTQAGTGLLDNGNGNNNSGEESGNCDMRSKKQKMWLVQSGRHVSLVPNQEPWYLNVNYTDVPIESFSNQDSLDSKQNNQKHYEDQQNFDSGLSNNFDMNEINVEKNNIVGTTNTTSTTISNYIPYTLVYLLIFFAILILIYKLGTRKLTSN